MKKNSITHLVSKDTPTREKIEYLIGTLIGCIYAFMTFYTVAKATNLLPSYSGQVPISTFVFLICIFISLIFIQTTTAYGFFYSRCWIKYIITLHASVIVITALLLLPFFDLEDMTKKTLLNGIPYYIMAIMAWFFTTLKTEKGYQTLIIILYCVALSATVSIQLFFSN